jgi:deoxyribodipyrimidine photo-lyase
MIESLVDLDEQLKKKGSRLYCFYGNQYDIISEIVEAEGIEKIMFNTDYSPYAKKRDQKIQKWCLSNNVACESSNDYYLHEPGSILVQSTGLAYKKYTPFYKDAIQRQVMPSVGTPYATVFKEMKGRYTNSIGLTDALTQFTTINDNILVRGGRSLGLQRLRQAVKQQKEYLDTRDYFPKKTSHLSAYIKFGCVSIREVYFSFASEYNKHHGLISELYWREFFAHVLNCYPQVVGESYQEKYRNLDWVNNKTHIKKWKEGTTGFPLVDAAMREMNATGYMHNRGRMTAASVLIKTLRVDWRVGEKYFATQLTDYDIASNNGNWQGISGTGVDMKPYFRDMNPFIQSEKFDKECEYIKQWVPELKDVPARDIHNWYDAHANYNKDITNYPAPIVDYKTAKDEMIQMYKNAK